VPEGCGVGIVGLGCFLPEAVRHNDYFTALGFSGGGDDDLSADAERAAGADSLIGRSLERWRSDPFRGAVERRVAAPEHRSSDLEAFACEDALRRAGRTIDQVDLLVGYSQLSDDAGPGNHGRVARKLGCSEAITAMTLEAGCASFLPQLAVSTRLVQAGDARAALLYQSSISSRINDPRSPVGHLLGDGAVAEVVGRVDPGLGLVGWVQRTRGELCDGLLLGRADGNPDWTAPSPVPLQIFGRDRAAAARMGAEGPAFARRACLELLDRHGLVPADIDFLVVAQASVWFGAVCAEAIGIPVERTVPPEDHFQRYGHLLAGSAPLNLWVAWSTGRLRKGDLVLLYSPGVGFTMAAVLLRWALDPPGT
jgi:3-oxoacyl-[acyl-carrier-protein] synthase-3